MRPCFPDVPMPFHFWPMSGKHPLTRRIVLHLPFDLSDSSLLKAKIESTYPAE